MQPFSFSLPLERQGLVQALPFPIFFSDFPWISEKQEI
jgi:hypothetical protein